MTDWGLSRVGGATIGAVVAPGLSMRGKPASGTVAKLSFAWVSYCIETAIAPPVPGTDPAPGPPAASRTVGLEGLGRAAGAAPTSAASTAACACGPPVVA